MKKILPVKRYFMILAASPIIIGMTLHNDLKNDQIVKGSSYALYSDASGRSYEKLPATHITFYTFDAEIIKQYELDQPWYLFNKERLLDPSAPKPRPVKCKVGSIPVPVRPGSLKDRWQNTLLFYDKHDNVIKRFPYDRSRRPKGNDLARFSGELDMTLLIRS